MTDMLSVLFDHYTKGIVYSRSEKEEQEATFWYGRLKEIAGDEAIDIWDAAVAEGAMMEEVCFQAGVKTGLKLAMELILLQ